MRRAVELRRRCSRSRPSSGASATSTSRAATRTSPASRASARPSSRCTARSSRSGRGGVDAPADLPPLPEPALPAIDQTFGIIVTGVGGTGVVTIGGDPRHGGASRRQGRRRHRHGRPRAEGRRGLQPYPHRQRPGRHPRHPRRGGAAPTSCSAATSSSPAPRRCWPRSSRAARALVVNTAEVLPGDFTRNADFSLPTERLKRAIADGGRRGQQPLRRRDATRDRAARQFDRRQHVHARLRLSDRRAAALGGSDREARSSSTARRWR